MSYLRLLKTKMMEGLKVFQDQYWTHCPFTLSDTAFRRTFDPSHFGDISIHGIGDTAEAVHTHFCTRQDPRFYFNATEREDIRLILCTSYPDNTAATLREAACLLAHQLQIFGPSRYQLGEAIDWAVDMLSGKRWPLSYYKNIRTYGQALETNDVLYIAKIHRHQHLLTLARAYLYSHNPQYRQELVDQIVDWIRQNPYKMGIGWWSPLVVAQRALSWIWSLMLVGLQQIETEKFWTILKNIYLHAKFIEENLSVEREHSNNHVIGEAATLAIMGIFFPEFNEAKQWKKNGLAILEQEFSHQFFDSGFHREQSVAYHIFVTELYTHVYLLCRRNNGADCQFLAGKLEKLYDFLLTVYQPCGAVPRWGDDGEIKAVQLSDRQGPDLSSMLSLGATLFHRPDMKKITGQLGEEALWLVTTSGYKKFQDMPTACVTRHSLAYRDAGIVVMRDGWQPTSKYMAIDCGPQGLGQAGHGHADALSFEVWANGRKMIVDPGTFTYNGPYKWRQYFRGTTAHNTVVVDTLDQSAPVPHRPFGWSSLANARLCAWNTAEDFDYFVGEHDGYERLPKPVTHRRSILFIKGEYWILSDVVTGHGVHLVESLFHFLPGEVTLNSSTGELVTRDAHVNIQILPLERPRDCTVIEGHETPIQGWFSSEYGSKVPAPVLQYSHYGTLPVCFDTVLYPFLGQEAPPVVIEKIPVYGQNHTATSWLDARCARLRQSNRVEDYYLVSSMNAAVKSFEEFVTDGQVVFVRKCGNRITKSLVIKGTFLYYKGHPIEFHVFT